MRKSRIVEGLLIFIAAASLPSGATCNTSLPTAGGVATSLLNQTQTSSPFLATFSPTQSGKSVTVTVVASLVASRPIFSVSTASGGAVLLEFGLDKAQSSIATGSFTSTGTDLLILKGNESGSTVSPLYALSAVQAP